MSSESSSTLETHMDADVCRVGQRGFLLRRKAVNAKTVQPLPAERVLATPPRILPHAISVCVFVVLEPFDLCS